MSAGGSEGYKRTSGAKDDAINPRLGNRYNLFPLSHRPDDYPFLFKNGTTS